METLEKAWLEIEKTKLRDNSGLLLIEAGLPFFVYAVVYRGRRGIAVAGAHPECSFCDAFETNGISFFSSSIGDLSALYLLGKFPHEKEFVRFVDDLLDSGRYVRAADANFGIQIFKRVISMWCAFFKGAGRKRDPDIQGVFGELLVVQAFLEESVESDRILNAWNLGERTSVDFSFSLKPVDIEVKTFISSKEAIVNISSIDQLTVEPGRALYLIAYEVLVGRGIRISELYTKVHSVLEGKGAGFVLEDRFFRFGIPPALLIDYDHLRYEVVGVKVFEVVQGFPSISRTNTASSIVSAKYELSLTGLVNEFARDFSEIASILRS